MKNLGLVILVLLVTSPAAFARGAVFLFGGGARAPEALNAFVAATGGPTRARVLIVAWASEQPEDTASGVRAELLAAGVAEAPVSLAPPAGDDELRAFNQALERATGIFFSGGDQMRLLDGIDRTPALRERIGRRWQGGVALAGTSAGTAALSERVFTGAEELTVIDPSRIALRPGLAVLANVIIDQHFIVRQRENRLFSAVLRYPETVGVGIDEDNALVVGEAPDGSGPLGRVVGPTAVLFVEATPDSHRLSVSILRQGECWDFAARAPRACP